MRTQANLNSHKALRVLDRAYRNSESAEQALSKLHEEGYPNVTEEDVIKQFDAWDAACSDAPKW